MFNARAIVSKKISSNNLRIYNKIYVGLMKNN